MLKHLHIRNLAIIDELSLDFGAGFSSLTGETGAGKSILIDALGLITGTRAESALVRAGQEKAEVSAEFDLSDAPDADAWLRDNELSDADDARRCVIRRVVYAEGRTRAFINGQPANAAPLRELGERLIEVFGQSESQTLLRGDIQRQLLDDYGGHAPLLANTTARTRDWQTLGRRIEEARALGARDPAALEELREQLQELEALNLQDGELERLEADHRRLANAGRLLEDGQRALECLYEGDSSADSQLSATVSLVSGLSGLDEDFSQNLQLLESAQAQTREAAQHLRQLLDRLDLDPAQLAALERRMSAVQDLARKHRIKAAALPQRLLDLREQLAAQSGVAERMAALERERAAALAAYREAARKLSAAREKAAKKFSEGITRVVRTLGMANAAFSVSLSPAAAQEPRAHGDDDIRFDFTANPGQPPRPLAKVASGGELSRVSLAIQVTSLQQSGTPTMIFDEVDAGIGGAVAEIVGQQLRALGERRQVLCVTHLAQVAAQSTQHYAIRKEVKAGQTYTRVVALTAEGRVEEVARMQGGVEISAAAVQHAKELLKRAKKPDRSSI